MAYTLAISKRVGKDMAGLPKEARERIIEKLKELANEPFAPGTIKLKGEASYRVRVGDYRIVFDVDTKTQTITVLAVGDRKDIYKR
ncbi:type II toxin-antitoxin system RelE family toxin [Meiothermus ruber]|uniref:Plasmid stabilization system n=1 Tax=Meiothermus ruber (strain ATCC 35948 / DSM 1279 / VKM B-1258 / 21) TaxID=504728 RepID=D3PPD9_MEIRD|nr:type II toxin-antitoxin system RelE/ParE family toxin [Meiothermus ruber]ADD27548.1 plasmid stabilization system [Meiothermus ruber DSM 1279]AGK04011.1 plasmid stabilization system [Meiothermus ruber DSM 1279]MCL6529864.1 type II toxin-antitoxin system RelE/ParE family toxin [Meiothermus ruber]GAO74472.1 plasmid stabilization system [Meiothermus ruber H328]